MSEVIRFTDDEGQLWRAYALADATGDYKGRYFLAFRMESETEADELPLPEVRWNSADTAERTLQTMSEVELRRRLRSAAGRRQPALP